MALTKNELSNVGFLSISDCCRQTYRREIIKFAYQIKAQFHIDEIVCEM